MTLFQHDKTFPVGILLPLSAIVIAELPVFDAIVPTFNVLIFYPSPPSNKTYVLSMLYPSNIPLLEHFYYDKHYK